jgi:hypothetical protein
VSYAPAFTVSYAFVRAVCICVNFVPTELELGNFDAPSDLNDQSYKHGDQKGKECENGDSAVFPQIQRFCKFICKTV